MGHSSGGEHTVGQQVEVWAKGQWSPAKGAKGAGGEAGEGIWLANEEIRVSWSGCIALCCSCFPIACVNSWLIGGKEKRK